MLETIGLITVIWVAVVLFAKYAKSQQEARDYQAHLDAEAMFISYRLAIRRLHRLHPEPHIRKALERAAEFHCGGVSTLSLASTDDQYRNLHRADPTANDAYRQAEASIQKRGYPLAVEGESIVNRWWDNRVVERCSIADDT